MFRLPDAYVGRDNFDLTEDTECKWAFNFNNSNLSRYSTGYGCNNSWMKQCPNEATLTVKKNDKEWEFTFTMLDYGMFGYTEQGTKNVLTIEWKGPATKYTGSQKNDMTDADY